MTLPAIRALTAPVRDYAWGSRTSIAALQGRAVPSDGPEAEAWFGAHPGAPSLTADATGREAPLAEVLAADPGGELGAETVARFGPRLPFLVKLLAAESPLSLQAHPSADQAAAGFAAEEAAGVAIDAPERLYRDAEPKPELLYALTPFTALCGFRGPPRTALFLEALDVPALDAVRSRLAADAPGALSSVIEWALRSGRDEAAATLPDLRTAAARLLERLGTAASAGPDAADEGGWWSVATRWIVELIDRYPGDPGTLVALLLRIVELHPGEAIHLPAGNLHAYLAGTGVEVMASSDNVLRGGLTPKHVDVDALLDVVDARFLPVPYVPGTRRSDDEVVHATPTPHFRFAHRELGPGAVTLDRRGPEIVVVVGGDAVFEADGQRLELASGHGAFVPARTREVRVRGSGQLFRATPGDPTVT